MVSQALQIYCQGQNCMSCVPLEMAASQRQRLHRVSRVLAQQQRGFVRLRHHIQRLRIPLAVPAHHHVQTQRRVRKLGLRGRLARLQKTSSLGTINLRIISRRHTSLATQALTAQRVSHAAKQGSLRERALQTSCQVPRPLLATAPEHHLLECRRRAYPLTVLIHEFTIQSAPGTSLR